MLANAAMTLFGSQRLTQAGSEGLATGEVGQGVGISSPFSEG